MADEETVTKLANEVAEVGDADVLFFNGELSRPIDNKFIRYCVSRNRRRNVLLILVTPGGDADAAYRIARCLQDSYEQFTVFVPGWCKSAGTLLAIGADDLILSVFGELGPLDVQLGKTDELFDYSSGLDVDSAIQTLETSAYKMFQDYMLAIKHQSGNRITFKTASEISASVVVGLMSNIYKQIDPMTIGETARLMAIAKDYGERLSAKSKNFARDDSLDMLVSSYSSHGFVIDLNEAATLFKNVSRPSDELSALQEALGRDAIFPVQRADRGTHILRFLSDEKAEEQDQPEATNDEDQAKSGADSAGDRSGEGRDEPDSRGAARKAAGASVSKVSPLVRPGADKSG